MTRRRYRNPPIEEAVCEFHFQPGREWDGTLPGKFHLQLGSDYAGKPQEQLDIETTIHMTDGQSPSLQPRVHPARVRLLTEDHKRFVSIGPNVMSIHMLRPYQGDTEQDTGGWEEFLSRISTALNAYWIVAQPDAISRIGIRYINKIVFDYRPIHLEHYFRSVLPTVNGLPKVANEFRLRIEYGYPNGVTLVLTQGSVESPPEQVAIMLDLDVIWKGGNPVHRDDAMKKVTELRDLEREAFEALITDQARAIFDAD